MCTMDFKHRFAKMLVPDSMMRGGLGKKREVPTKVTLIVENRSVAQADFVKASS